MKKNILMRTNILVCLVIIIGFTTTAVLSYQANYTASVQNIEQVSALTSEGIYYQLTSIFTKPVNISLTMANDSLLKGFLADEKTQLDNQVYIETIREYLDAYRAKYQYDSVFLVSAATNRYYNFNGLDRVLEQGNPENDWYFGMLKSEEDSTMNVDNDAAASAQNEITVFVNCKIKDNNGKTMGIVGVGVRIGYLQSLLRDYEDKFGVDAFLIGGDGTVEISTNYTGYEKVNFFDIYSYDNTAKNVILNWKKSDSASSFWTSATPGENTMNYIVARYIPELGWHLVVERDTGLLIQKLNEQILQTVLIIAAIIAIILFVITFVIRKFNRQIVSLTRTNEQKRRTVFQQATEELYENIYELDITRNCPANLVTEQYFESLGAPSGTPYDKALRIVADKQIKEEFRQGYLDMFSPENVLHAYKNGQDTLRYDFMISTGGDYYWMRITARIIYWESDDSIHMLTYRQNIDAEKRQQRRMLKLSQTDEMTGLYTKTALRKKAESRLAEQPGKLFAFFIFDIDDFKQANDLYGHSYGDKVIISFTGTIKRHFSEGELVGRIGGDEFAAFLTIPDEAWARQKAEELCRALRSDHTADGQISWHISASIGVAIAPRDGKDFDTLYRRADRALYQTKKRGKSGYTIYSNPPSPKGAEDNKST